MSLSNLTPSEGCFLKYWQLILQNSSGSKKKWFGKKKLQTQDSYLETDNAPPPSPPPEEIILTHVENIENNHDHVEVATDLDAEVHVPAVQTQIAEVQVTAVVQFDSKVKDEVAATKIQTAFRRYLVGIFCKFYLNLHKLYFIHLFF